MVPGPVAGLLAAASAQSRFAFQFYPDRNCIHIIDKDLVGNTDWPLNDKAPVQIHSATSVGDLHSQLDRYSGADINKAASHPLDWSLMFRVQQPNRKMPSPPSGMQLTTIRDCIDRLLLANTLPESNLSAWIQAVSDESYPLTDGRLKGGKMRFIIRAVNISCQ